MESGIGDCVGVVSVGRRMSTWVGGWVGGGGWH
jgi:hypothetical protein